jgi:hypothetical protein
LLMLIIYWYMCSIGVRNHLKKLAITASWLLCVGMAAVMPASVQAHIGPAHDSVPGPAYPGGGYNYPRIEYNHVGNTPEGGDGSGKSDTIPAGAKLDFTARVINDGTPRDDVWVWINWDTNDVNLSVDNISFVAPQDSYGSRDKWPNCAEIFGTADFSCGSQGKSVGWKINHLAANDTRTYGVELQLSANMGSNAQVCSRGHVTVGNARSRTDSKIVFNDHESFTNYPRCYDVNNRTVSGEVRSTLNSNIKLPNAQVRYGRNYCSNEGAPEGTTLSAANGFYSFAWVGGQALCIGAEPTYNSTTDTYGVHTDYTIAQNSIPHRRGGARLAIGGFPSTYQFLFQVPGYYCLNDYDWLANCDNNNMRDYDYNSQDSYDIDYNPVPRNPLISKSAAPANSSLKPGNSITFTVNAHNDQDAIIPSYYLEDLIPLNVDPGSISMGTVSFSYPISEYLPGASDQTGNLDCSTGNTTKNLPSTFGTYECYIFTGTTGSPPSVRIHFNNLPPRTYITLRWTGKVKSAENIGVYPNASTLCANTSKSSWGDRNGVMNDCQDFTNGLQGVINYARETVNDGFSWAYSNGTYNPIPGAVGAVKTSTAPTDGSVASTPIIATDPRYNAGMFNIAVSPDTSQGPVYYNISDELESAIDYDGSTHGTTGVATGEGDFSASGKNISFDTASSAHSGFGVKAFYFGYKANAGVDSRADAGGNVTNTAKVCWLQYWLTSHPEACVSPSTSIKAVRVNDPYVTTDNGDVHAGGGIGTACALNPPNVASSSYLRGNPGASGRYFVSVNGDVGRVFGGTGSSDYGAVCRPDIVDSATKQMDKNGFVTYTTGKVDYASGSIVKTPPAARTTLNGLSGVKNRWTLFVDGDLYITDNITYAGGANTLGGTASLGVVVTGNLYIGPGVTQLDGFYVVGKKDSTIANKTSAGVVNTCAQFTPSFKTLNSGLSYNDCNRGLKINGVLMAKTFRFNRTVRPARDVSGNIVNPSEFVDFGTQYFAVTPPGFSDLQKFNPPVYVKEAPPRY